MKLLKKASAVLKDQNSILLAKLAGKTSNRNPDLETAVIKATSHEESKVDYKNAQRVFAWVRTSPTFMKPLIWSLSSRMNKTRSWVVSLKGLMLMHGIFCCKIPGIRKIGRLPFDLSNFRDCHSKSPLIWSLSAFVRSYFAFLDQKSVFMATLLEEYHKGRSSKEAPMVQVLEELERCQKLLDMLIQIRPDGIICYTLVLEAMDCIIVEVFDVYSRICSGIAGVLVGVLGVSQVEATMALKVLQKAASQGEELSSYFEFCKDIGVLNESEFPKVEQIPDEDIRDLERIIMNGVIEKKRMYLKSKDHHHHHHHHNRILKEQDHEKNDKNDLSKTIVTHNWVVFDDDSHNKKMKEDNQMMIKECSTNVIEDDPFAASLNYPPMILCGYENNGYSNANGLVQMGNFYTSNNGALSVINNTNNQTNLILSL